jgi:hypothetical protein
MEFLLEILKSTGPAGAAILIVFILMLLGIKILWETGKEERKARIDSEIRNSEKYESVVKQMFEVVNSNTKAITENTEITRELNENMRSLRTPSRQK